MIKLEKKDQAVGKTNDNIRNTNQIKEKSKGKNNSATNKAESTGNNNLSDLREEDQAFLYELQEVIIKEV